MHTTIRADFRRQLIEIDSIRLLNESDTLYYSVDILPFSGDESVLEYRGLVLLVYCDGQLIRTHRWPDSCVVPLSKDWHTACLSGELRAGLGTLVKFDARLLNKSDQRLMTATHMFAVPPPAQPYRSWRFDGKYWRAPVPHPMEVDQSVSPDDGLAWHWDEGQKAWIERRD